MLPSLTQRTPTRNLRNHRHPCRRAVLGEALYHHPFHRLGRLDLAAAAFRAAGPSVTTFTLHYNFAISSLPLPPAQPYLFTRTHAT